MLAMSGGMSGADGVLPERPAGSTRCFFLPLALSLAFFALSAAPAGAQTLPLHGEAGHLGALTCGGSTCHGAVQPWQNSAVQQNEYVVWSQRDPHAKAYDSLKGERAQRIARNLGLGDPTSAKICLDCHADNVPENKRSRQFKISDGVSCEACHGGAETWLGIHVSGAGNRADNLKAGMYPTEIPVARAKLCLSCHYGAKDRFVTHRIMGAGHPRLTFELDTFTAGRGVHHVIDADYRQRKPNTWGIRTWAIGQSVAVGETLAGLADPNRNRAGIFPELAFFDCHACHHPMSNLSWRARASTGLGPGVPRLNDANLIMLRVIARVLFPDLARTIAEGTRGLHQASLVGPDAVGKAIRDLMATNEKMLTALNTADITRPQLLRLFGELLAEGLAGEYATYMAAEQATMALAATIYAIDGDGALGKPGIDRLNKALERAYATTESEENFKPDAYIEAIKSLDGVRVAEIGRR